MVVLKKIKFLLLLVPLFALAGCDMDNGDDVRGLLQWVLIGAGAIILGLAYVIKAILPKKKNNPTINTPHPPPPPPPPTSTTTNTIGAPVHEPPKENDP